MEPIFMYWNKIKFEDNNNFKDFKVKFTNGDNLVSVFFKKKKDYHITSMDAFISLELDVKELKDYKEIKKISEIFNAILQNGVEHLYKEKKLELTYENQKHDLHPEKNKRKLFLCTVEFFDEKTKKIE